MRNVKPSDSADSRPEPPPSQVAAVAQIVRGMYIMRREAYDDLRFGLRSRRPPPRETYQRWDGFGSGGESVWDQIARVCLTHDIDPIEHVAAQFHSLDYAHPAPQPRELTHRRAVAKWEEEQPKMTAIVRTQLVCDHKYLRGQAVYLSHFGGLQTDDAYLNVLTTLKNQISSLYKHCVASSLADDDRFARAAELTLRKAALQFMAHRRNYRELLVGLLPPGFDERAFSIWSERYCKFDARPASLAERPRADRSTDFEW